MPVKSATTSESPRLQTLSREAFWQHHVRQWRDSGTSKMAYCRQYSLVYHQLPSQLPEPGDRRNRVVEYGLP